MGRRETKFLSKKKKRAVKKNQESTRANNRAKKKTRTSKEDDFSRVSSKTMMELVADVSTGQAGLDLASLSARDLADAMKRKPDPTPAAAPQISGPTEAAKVKISVPEDHDDQAEAPKPRTRTRKLPKYTAMSALVETVPEEFNNVVYSEVAKPATQDPDELANRNRYPKKGAPYVFWERSGLCERLVDSLKAMKFTHPTPIQSLSLPTSLDAKLDMDMVISSETGSGKTLTFALPVLNHLMLKRESELGLGKKNKNASKRTRDGEGEDPAEKTTVAVDRSQVTLHTLVVTPTRELALQINQNFIDLAKTSRDIVKVACIVGGMAPARQQRLLNGHPDVLICTPGRLWQLVETNEGCFLGHSISRRISFVVLDEADRLLQSGRFNELKLVLERVHSRMLPQGATDLDVDLNDAGEEWDSELQKFVPCVEAKEGGSEDEEGEEVESGMKKRKDQARPMPFPPEPTKNHRVLTYVTSATLSLAVNYARKTHGSRQYIRTSNVDTMGRVLTDLGLNQNHCHVFDMFKDSTKLVDGEEDAAGEGSHAPSMVVSKLHEACLRCPGETKELYLYYFLRTHPGRTIIFCNAISMIRRLTKLFELLKFPVYGLHASMQQRQRLKYVDRFKKDEHAILIATDVAARGLDVDNVRFVLHYQLPRSTDAYIHRCGRTARCGTTGFSLVFVAPTEFVAYKKLLASMQRETPLESFAVDHQTVHRLHPHLKIIYALDDLQRDSSKKKAHNTWVNNMADSADIDAEDDMLEHDQDGVASAKATRIRQLRQQLDKLISRDTLSGTKGAFRTGAKQMGTAQAVEKVESKAKIQTYELQKPKAKKNFKKFGAAGDKKAAKASRK